MNQKTTKADFVRQHPKVAPADLVLMAQEKGIELTSQYVQNIRWHEGKKRRTKSAPAASARSSSRSSAASPAASRRGATSRRAELEEELRRTAAELAAEIVAHVFEGELAKLRRLR